MVLRQPHPLLIDEALHVIFDDLDFRSLKKCRQVCKTWNRLATKKVKLVLFGKYEEQQGDALESLLTSISLPSFINVEIRGTFGVPISTFLHVIGTNIQFFTLNSGKQRFFCRLSNFEDLVLYAKLLIYVLDESQYKYFKFLDVYKCNPLWATVLKITSDWESPYFADYIELCPSLEAIIIPSQKNYLQGIHNIFGSERLEALDSTNKLKSIREINFILLKNEGEHLKRFSSIQWNLTSFEITVSSLNPIPLVRTCLTQLSPTLKNLIVQVSPLFDEYHLSICCFKQDNWIIPVSLSNLKSLTVTSIGNKKFITRSLVATLQLPKLSSLTLKGFADEDAFNNLVGNRLDDLQSKSLKSLEICCRKEAFLDATFFLRRVNPWPNVRELKLTRPSIQIISNVFCTMKSLEILDILLEISKGKRVIPWDSILGNAPFDPRNENFLFSCSLPDLSILPRPCLKDLKELKSLKIGFTWDSIDCSDWKLTDHFITNVLMDLKELQYFHATQNKFSEEALDKLRVKMRPFCNINVKAASNQNYLN